MTSDLYLYMYICSYFQICGGRGDRDQEVEELKSNLGASIRSI